MGASGSGRLLLLLLAAIAGVIRPGEVAAQDVRLATEPADSASRVIARVLERGEYLLIDRDTILAADALIDHDLVIANATVRLEGQVRGTIAIVGGELFVRPGAVVTGLIAVAGGAAYPSGLARMGPIIEVPMEIAVDVAPDDDGYALTLMPPAPPPRFRPSGPFGIAVPTYDRVDGLTVGWSARHLLSASDEGPYVLGGVTFGTERGRVGGSAGVRLPLGRGLWLRADVERATRTNDGWIRRDLVNSLAAAAAGSDVRDYHESDAVTAGVARRPTQPLIEGETFVGPRFLLRASRDRSLSAGDPWALTGGDWRENPAIDPGTIVSAIAGAAISWRGATSRFDGDLSVEWAPPGIGDHRLTRAVVDGAWSMVGLWGHRIDVYSRAALTPGTDPLPRQRWSFLGGTGTLPTLELAERRGDNLVFVRSRYAVPIRGLRIPLVGPPAVEIVHAAGTAWITGDPVPRWDQNLGLGLFLRPVRGTVWVDPAAAEIDPVLTLSLSYGL